METESNLSSVSRLNICLQILKHETGSTILWSKDRLLSYEPYAIQILSTNPSGSGTVTVATPFFYFE